ncbi:MAG: maleylpyruvate isomerase N-terminal domain-containing protein [Acidimicrobiales bacterium]
MANARPTSARDAFAAAVGCFLATSAEIGDGWWESPATDLWTVGQLFAHVVRGMAVMSDYLDADPTPPDAVLGGAAAYFRAALDTDGVHEGIADRAVAAASAAGPDRSAWAREVGDAAIRRAAETGDDRVLVHFAGAIRFGDYLETRITEVVLHTFDLQVACGLEVAAPADALAITNGVLLDLVDRADPAGLALALSGRPGHLACNVLG